MKQITYNQNYFDYINRLSYISQSMIFRKDEEKGVINVMRGNQAMSIGFSISTPIDSFDFDGQSLCISSFAEFNSIVKTMKPVEIFHDNNKFIIKTQIGDLNYVLSDEKSVQPDPKSLRSDIPDLIIQLSKEDIHNINTVCSKIKAEYIKIRADKTVEFVAHSSSFKNSFVFPINVKEPPKRSFEYSIYSEVFSKLPDENMVLNVEAIGRVMFGFSNELVLVKIVTGKVNSTRGNV